MKTNWKALVNKTNAKLYAIPEGWTRREDLGPMLDCSPDKVGEVLRAALQLGMVEQKQFPVWSADLGRKVSVWCYREIQQADGQVSPPKTQGWAAEQTAEAKRLKKAGKTWREIGLVIGKNPEAVRKWLYQH